MLRNSNKLQEGNCFGSVIDTMSVDNKDNLTSDEIAWQQRRQERVRRMRLEKEKQLKRQRIFKLVLPVIAIVVVGIAGVLISVNASKAKEEKPSLVAQNTSQGKEPEKIPEKQVSAGQVVSPDVQAGVTDVTNTIVTSEKRYEAHTTRDTSAPPEEVNSTNVVFVDLSSGDILAQSGYKELINPASMTKVLTVLVAAEHVDNLDDTFTMTIDITDYSFSNDCSNVGFEVGEVVTVRDLFYGTILPSGGDAAVGLATYVAGSHEAFVDMMNDKLRELGLASTAHFTNCVGLFDEEHYCSVYDMAMIMEAALENELCREVLGARTYTTTATPEHPQGITISNWFIRRIEDKNTGGKILGAKTGFVNQSGNCAVSYGVDNAGNGYVCVTTGAHSSWRCIYDHVAIYKKYAKE